MSDTNKPSPVAGPASEPAPLHHIINMRWAYEQACDLADWANANGTTLGNDEKLYQAAIKLRDTLGKATHAAQPVPAPAVDERTPDSGHLAAAPEQQLPEPVAWMHNGYVSKNKGRVLHDEQNNRSCGFKAQPVHALYTADQLRTAIAAERERNPSVQANLARGLLWLAFVWNDHNFEAAHKEARRIAERAGIRSFEDANAWLEAAPAGAGAKGEGE